MKKTLLNLFTVFVYCSVNGQVGINTETPLTTLHIKEGAQSNSDGLLIPRITADVLKSKNSLYNQTHEGTLIYITKGLTQIPDETVLPTDKVYFVTKPGFYYFNGNQWVNINTSGWGLLGNEINDGEFLGTTNNKDLIFKRNNITIGKLGDTNLALGLNSLSNTTGSGNVALGNTVLVDAIRSSNNTLLGNNIGAKLEGNNNILIGSNINAYDTRNGSNTNDNKIVSNFMNIGNSIYGNDIEVGENSQFGINNSKIGIGQVNPLAKLHITPSSDQSPVIIDNLPISTDDQDKQVVISADGTLKAKEYTKINIKYLSSDYRVMDNDYFLIFKDQPNNTRLTLPNPAQKPGQMLNVRNTRGSSIIANYPIDGYYINDDQTSPIEPGQTIGIVSDGNQWILISISY